jgi:hypothetical protein
MVPAAPTATEALGPTGMSGPRLSPARLPAKCPLVGTLFAFQLLLEIAQLLASHSDRSGRVAQLHPLFVGTQKLRHVLLEPGLIGHRLRPHDAPARARAYCAKKGLKLQVMAAHG